MEFSDGYCLPAMMPHTVSLQFCSECDLDSGDVCFFVTGIHSGNHIVVFDPSFSEQSGYDILAVCR
jgi:hypothetical protein